VLRRQLVIEVNLDFLRLGADMLGEDETSFTRLSKIVIKKKRGNDLRGRPLNERVTSVN
jgi:hypothetical protein